jgi:methionyl-tRNA synthetase
MSTFKKFLVTSALPYANGPLHFGHIAGVYLPADIYTRHRRLQGHTVKHISGSDEHGVAIMLAAEKEQMGYQAYVDQWHSQHLALFEKYEISFDFFGRTSEKYHEEEVLRWFRTLYENGFIAKQSSKQLFCLDDNRFLPDRYVEGICYNCNFPDARGDECPNCGEWIDPIRLINPRSKISGSRRIEIREVDQYYLLLTRFEKQFQDWIKTKTEWRKLVTGFIQGLLKNGMVDRAITRDLDWGIDVPLPDSIGKKLYVWFDAPIGYVSILKKHLETMNSADDYLKDWWQSDQVQISHFIGKDNIIFHACIWPCMIMGTQFVQLPTEIPANEFVNLEGKQFSKSSGWFIDTDNAVEEFGPDALRFYLCSIIPESGDTNFSWDGFLSVYLEFGNKIGNFIHRSLTFQEKHWPKGLSANSFNDVLKQTDFKRVREHCEQIISHLNNYHFARAQDELLFLSQAANEFFQLKQPWAQIKTDRVETERTLAMAATYIAILGIFLEPFTPRLSRQIMEFFGNSFPAEIRSDIYKGNLELLVEQLAGGFKPAVPPRVLIPRIDSLVIAKWKDLLNGLNISK